MSPRHLHRVPSTKGDCPINFSGNTVHPHFLYQIHRLSPTPFSTRALSALEYPKALHRSRYSKDIRRETISPPQLCGEGEGTDAGLSRFRKRGTSQMPRHEEGKVRDSWSANLCSSHLAPSVFPLALRPLLALLKAIKPAQPPAPGGACEVLHQERDLLHLDSKEPSNSTGFFLYSKPNTTW